MSTVFTDFIADCRREIDRTEDAADRVIAIAPLMQALLREVGPHLGEAHRRPDPAHYARNAIHIEPSGDLSLFALVWLPGQWTPVHDHGSWGVVGIVEGVLEERALMSAHGDITANDGIVLRRGGMVLLNPGAVSSFVPNPDHIHMTGVPEDRAPCLSLHLYGRNMNSFHIYDVAAGTRRLIDVPHHAVR
jgi:predicted metal-dependent enzyme (double-stranded beta helix superfamily)